MVETLGSVIIGIVIFAVVFFITRGIMLWYWRVNEVVERLDSMESHLKRIAAAYPEIPVDLEMARSKKKFTSGEDVKVNGSEVKIK
jgi:hypothetical protein